MNDPLDALRQADRDLGPRHSEPESRTEVARRSGGTWLPNQPDARTDSNLFAPPTHELERVLTAISDNYDVEDLGYAGDARVVNLRDQLTGSYVMTITLTHTR